MALMKGMQGEGVLPQETLSGHGIQERDSHKALPD
jgi:hypothetical protein